MIQARTPVIVETNVLVTANEHATHVSKGCLLACIEFLEHCRTTHRIVLDRTEHIWQEYEKRCEYKGEPGFGDKFFKWLHDNHGNRSICQHVQIEPTAFNGDVPCDFREFPQEPAFARFDPSDRKFVAVAIAARSPTESAPPIYNATDTDWWHHREAFRRIGLEVRFLCQDLMNSGS